MFCVRHILRNGAGSQLLQTGPRKSEFRPFPGGRQTLSPAIDGAEAVISVFVICWMPSASGCVSTPYSEYEERPEQYPMDRKSVGPSRHRCVDFVEPCTNCCQLAVAGIPHVINERSPVPSSKAYRHTNTSHGGKILTQRFAKTAKMWLVGSLESNFMG